MSQARELLTTAEVAARVRKHPKTVERAIRAGRLRAARLSGTRHGPYGIAPEWVDEWIGNGLVRTIAPSPATPPLPDVGRRAASKQLPLTRDMGRDRTAA